MPTALTIALAYIGRGWRPVPVAYKAKKPTGKNWQARRIDATTAPHYFNGKAQNIGVLLGTPSGIVDIDLDCVEALDMADEYLPPTGAIFGRASKPRSHWVYKVRNPQPTKRHEFGKGDVIVEYRSEGAQTVFPGSVHESGEAICWDSEGAPAEVDDAELAEAVARLADAVRAKRGRPTAEKTPAEISPCQNGTVVSQSAGGTDKALSRCLKYLAKMPEAVSGQGGHKATFSAACMCWRFGLDDGNAWEAMAWFNANKCHPVWNDDDLRHKLDDAHKAVAEAAEFGTMGISGVPAAGWYNPLPAWILATKLRPHRRMVLQTIANKCRRQPLDAVGSLGDCIIGYQALADATGMGYRTCIRHVRTACSEGLLVKVKKGGFDGQTGECFANVYRIPGAFGALGKKGKTTVPK